MNQISTTTPSATDHRAHIFLRSDFQSRKTYLDDILYLEALGDYVKVFTTEKRHMVLATLKSFEEKLSGQGFMRVHRSYIINLKKVQGFARNTVVVEGTDIPVSRSYKAELKEVLSS